MLYELIIENFVLIEKAHIHFQPGLTVISGETGSGKSLIFDAFQQLSGARSDQQYIRTNCEQAVLHAIFQLSETHPVYQHLEPHGILPDETFNIKRILTMTGPNRCFINDTPVTLHLLKQVASQLFYIKGQFSEQSLLNPKQHIHYVDEHLAEPHLKTQTNLAFHAWQNALKQEQAYKKEIDTFHNEGDQLQETHQLLAELKPQIGEEAELIEKKQDLQNQQANFTTLQALDQCLNTILSQHLASQLKQLEKATLRSPKLFESLYQRLDQIEVELKDLTYQIHEHLSQPFLDQTHLTTLEERLWQLKDLARKYQLSVDELPQLQQDISQKLARIDQLTWEYAQAQKETQKQANTYLESATQLSNARRQASQKLIAQWQKELSFLNIPQANLVASQQTLTETQYSADGFDSLRFLFSANTGQPPQSLDQIASGGELSRLMLAFECIPKQTHQLNNQPIYLFDEIDQGVGGKTAFAIGKRLQELSHNLQVIVISHAPQVAASAFNHLLVEKTQTNHKTCTRIRSLQGEEKITEIARMISGEHISDEAFAAARELCQPIKAIAS